MEVAPRMEETLHMVARVGMVTRAKDTASPSSMLKDLSNLTSTRTRGMMAGLAKCRESLEENIPV